MRDTNVGLGMVPHKKNCQCDECIIERLLKKFTEQKQRAEAAEAEVERLQIGNDIAAEEIARLEARVEELDSTLRRVASLIGVNEDVECMRSCEIIWEVLKGDQ